MQRCFRRNLGQKIWRGSHCYEFLSALWSTLCQRFNIQHVMTTAYHLQSNKMINGTHRQMKDALWAGLKQLKQITND